jgi:hypothetical protein
MTKLDLIGHNDDLIAEAVRHLRTKPVYSLSVKRVQGKRRTYEIAASSTTRRVHAHKKIFRVDVSVNDWPFRTLMATNGNLSPTTITIDKLRSKLRLSVQAFDHHNNIVAAYRNR